MSYHQEIKKNLCGCKGRGQGRQRGVWTKACMPGSDEKNRLNVVDGEHKDNETTGVSWTQIGRWKTGLHAE